MKTSNAGKLGAIVLGMSMMAAGQVRWVRAAAPDGSIVLERPEG